MSTTTSPLDDDPTSFFDSMLNELPRFPYGNFGWEQVDVSAVDREPNLLRHTHDYAEIVGEKTPALYAFQTVRLMDFYPEDFTTLAAEIAPEAWRLLFYAGVYSQEMLSHFRFHPYQELIRLCDPSGPSTDVPAEFIGTTETANAVAAQIQYLIREKGTDFAKATWSVLSLAQRLSLTKSEVLKCQWWSPLWIRALNSRLNSGS